MRLTVYSDYAFRVLIYLGTRQGERATIRGIAECYDISRNHLTKVVHQLGARGYIETVRGKGGGLQLTRDPEGINVGAVLRDTEEGFGLVECMRPEGRDKCRIQGSCRLQGILGEATQAFLAVLDRYTLADLLQNRTALQQLLDGPMGGGGEEGTAGESARQPARRSTPS